MLYRGPATRCALSARALLFRDLWPAMDPLRGKPLQLTLRGLRSWRTGDWRIVYRVLEDRVEILVVAEGHRREVYDRLRERLR